MKNNFFKFAPLDFWPHGSFIPGLRLYNCSYSNFEPNVLCDCVRVGIFLHVCWASKELPWIHCNETNDWHTPNCYTRELSFECRQQNVNTTSLAYTWYNGSCVDMVTYCKKHGYEDGVDNNTSVENVNFDCIESNSSVSKFSWPLS